jgi:hypothetical protein
MRGMDRANDSVQHTAPRGRSDRNVERRRSRASAPANLTWRDWCVAEGLVPCQGCERTKALVPTAAADRLRLGDNWIWL